MGRIDTNASHQYQQQGLQFQELHQTPSAAETIDDAPPHEEDLYEPPPTDYQPESSAATNINNKPPPQPPQTNYPPTTPHDPQPFPPPHHHPHHHVHSFPPNQDHDHEKPPPPPQPFPPPHEEQTAQTFPPIDISTSGDQYNFHQQQHPNVGMQFPAQQTNFHHHQPAPAAVGGIPVGFSPSPVLIPQQNQLPTQVWKTGLFECMRNPQNAIITLFFPCVTFGQIAEILDSGSTSCGTSGMLYSLIACCIAMPCIMSCTYRSKLRSKFRLIESPAPDCVVHCFCEYCALCQEYRELQERGIDPSVGWLGNVAKQQQKLQQFGMTPPMQQRMM